MTYDFIIVGGGIVGLSTAWQLKNRQPQAQILVLEKERDLGIHQTGRNSGVIHAGIYYTPGSLKATLCHQGVEATIGFCRDHDIPYEQCGKLLVACDDTEIARMQALFPRCQENDATTRLLDKDELSAMEPAIAGGAAIFSPRTGIVDYRQIATTMARLFQNDGGEVRTGVSVVGIDEDDEEVTVDTSTGAVKGKFLIACAGLLGDRLARLQGIETSVQLIPFKGEFYRIDADLVAGLRHLIYPIPDPALPFLGVHLTRRIDGSVIVGPNAVLSGKREGYNKFDFDRGDVLEMLRYPGLRNLISRHLGAGCRELAQTAFKSLYVRQIRKFLPTIRTTDLHPFPPGIRAQAIDPDGNIVDDFLFAGSPRSLHVLNAPSPAATSAIPIGNTICDRVLATAAKMRGALTDPE